MEDYHYFVAHKFSKKERDDLRQAIDSAFNGTGLKAFYADIEYMCGEHILNKIENRIHATQFGIYDITDGNPNVILEYGLAKGAGKPTYLICEKNAKIPADLQGLDRIEYESYKDLTNKIKEHIIKKELEKRPKISSKALEPPCNGIKELPKGFENNMTPDNSSVYPPIVNNRKSEHELPNKINNGVEPSKEIDLQFSISIGVIPEKQEELHKPPEFLSDANDCIRILGTSLRTIWVNNDFINKLVEVGKDKKIKILLLNPKSKYVKERAKIEEIPKERYKESISTTIKYLKDFKKNGKIPNMELYLYNEYPIWHFIIIDNKFAKIGYFPNDREGSKAPYYIFNDQVLSYDTNACSECGRKLHIIFNDKGKCNPIEPFIIYFDKLAQRSRKKI